MDFSLTDGDGTTRPRKSTPGLPSAARMEEGRQVLKTGDKTKLMQLKQDVLFYLCFENDLRRGGKKKDFVRELIQWVRVILEHYHRILTRLNSCSGRRRTLRLTLTRLACLASRVALKLDP